MTNLLLNDATKQFIIEHWAAIQPKDIGANWNPRTVEFVDDEALVTCHSPVPPITRFVRVPLARAEAWANQMGYPPEPVPDTTFEYTPPALDEDDTDPGDEYEPVEAAPKPKRTRK